MLAVPLITAYLNASFALNCPVIVLKNRWKSVFSSDKSDGNTGSWSQFETSLHTNIHNGQYWIMQQNILSLRSSSLCQLHHLLQLSVLTKNTCCSDGTRPQCVIQSHQVDEVWNCPFKSAHISTCILFNNKLRAELCVHEVYTTLNTTPFKCHIDVSKFISKVKQCN